MIRIKENVNRPKYLFKYYRNNNFALEGLQNNSIYFAPIRSFNDPFENTFRIDSSFSSVGHYKLMDGRKIKNEKQHKKLMNEILTTYKTQSLSKFGIACFSILPTNYLMWSHYSENHKGFCLGFDTTQDMSFFKEAEKVSYCEMLPNVDFNKDELSSQFVEIIYSKSLEWNYEQEYRIVSGNFGSRKFNEDSLCYVIFGCKMLKKDKEKLAKYVQSKYKKVEIIDSFLHPNEYKIAYKYYETNRNVVFDTRLNFNDLE